NYTAFNQPTISPIIKSHGFTGSDDAAAALRIFSRSIPSGETAIFPPQRQSPTSAAHHSLVLMQVNSGNMSYSAIFYAAGVQIAEVHKGSLVEFGAGSDPGGSGLGIWMNTDFSINVKNNSSSTLRVSIMRFG